MVIQACSPVPLHSDRIKHTNGPDTALAPGGLLLKTSHETKSNPVALQLWEAARQLGVKLLPVKTDVLSPVAGPHSAGEK